MGNELVPVNGDIDIMQLGNVLAKSQYFQDAKDAAQAVVKVLAGRELGIGPVASMTGIYIVKGRVTLSSTLMAAQIKRSGKYDYRIRQHDEQGCVIEFFQGSESIGTSSFTQADAKAAGLWNASEPWKKTPRNMMFARAMSNGAKWYCPDVFSSPVYTPDEFDATSEPVNEPPMVVDAKTGEVLSGNGASFTPPSEETETPAKRPPTKEGLIKRIRELWRTTADLGFDVPTEELATDLEEMTIDQLMGFGMSIGARLSNLKENTSRTLPKAA